MEISCVFVCKCSYAELAWLNKVDHRLHFLNFLINTRENITLFNSEPFYMYQFSRSLLVIFSKVSNLQAVKDKFMLKRKRFHCKPSFRCQMFFIISGHHIGGVAKMRARV